VTAADDAPMTLAGIAADYEAKAEASDARLQELQKAAETVGRAAADPLKMAAENAGLRSTVQGAYALIHALVGAMGGKATIPRTDWQAISPAERLEVRVDADGNAILQVRRVNRAERRAKP